jgi:hypothetical protein
MYPGPAAENMSIQMSLKIKSPVCWTSKQEKIEMKKIIAIAIALMLFFALAACGGGGDGGSSGGGDSAPGGAASTLDGSCPCWPDCTVAACENGCDKVLCERECKHGEVYDCKKGKCCKSGGSTTGSHTFRVEINTYVAGWQPIYKTFGEAVVVLDQVDESGKYFGVAEGNGEYLEFFVDGFDYGQEETTYDFTVQLSGFDPRVGDSITVGINRYSAEAVTSFSTWDPADIGSPKVQLPDAGFIVLYMLGQEILDPETGLYLFEVPMEDGNGYKTFNLDQASAEFEGHIEMSITVTQIS